jgi:hypothetical protein
MAWARFSARYDHRWPSRAVTHFRPDRGVDGNGLYQVRREVLDAAKDAGKATEAKKPVKPAPDDAEREAADGLAGRDPAPNRDDASPNELEPDASDRRDDGVSAPAGAG